MRTIKANDEIVGSVLKFVIENDAEITYWIDRKFWGQGIATTALKDFLKIGQISQFMDVLHLTTMAHKKF